MRQYWIDWYKAGLGTVFEAIYLNDQQDWTESWFNSYK